MKNIVSLLIFLMFFCVVNAQDVNQKRLVELRKIVNQIAKQHINNVQAVTNFDDKTEFWSFGNLGDSIRSYEVWSYQSQYLFSEYYVEQNGKLIYAIESETFIPINHFPQSIWNCVLFVDKGKIINLSSLGHGKTEDDNWNPEEIIEHFVVRKKQSTQIVEYYNPK